MPRYTDYTDFAHGFVEVIPGPEAFPVQSSGFWEQLEVNSERALQEANDPEYVERGLSPVGAGGLQVLCLWAGLEPVQSRADLTASAAHYLSDNLQQPGCQSMVLINEFLYRRRADAIESASRLLLPGAGFGLISGSAIGRNSKRFCYALLCFLENRYYLRILMLYEKAERAGYERHVLVPRTQTAAGNPIDKESITAAHQYIEAGVDLAEVVPETVNEVLNVFEQRYGPSNSMCFDVFEDAESQMTEVFIFRDLRESHIREVEGVVFGDEAELIVLRLGDRMRSVEEHSATGVGVRVAGAIASALLNGATVRYIKDEELTEQSDLQTLIEALASDTDDRLQLRELYLEEAPIEDSPILILRCEKKNSLSSALDFFRARGDDLLEDLQNIRNLKIGFAVPSEEDAEKEDVYSFTVHCERASSMRYFVPYAVANIPTAVRTEFETYLRGEYNVRVVPGTP